MNKIPKKLPQDQGPPGSGRKSKLLPPTKTRTSGARDPVDEALQDQIHRASLHAFSGEAVSDEKIMADAVERGLVAVGLKVYFRMMELWGIDEKEAAALLGFDHRPVEAEIGIEPFKRLSHTVGIYRALHTLLSRDSANAWMKKPNSAEIFGGKPALELLRTGTPGFEAVRSHLAAAL